MSRNSEKMLSSQIVIKYMFAPDTLLLIYSSSHCLRRSIIYIFLCNCANVGQKTADTKNILDSQLKTILENVRLNYLLERVDAGWDANLNWQDILSLGEQQRLGMVSQINTSHLFKQIL